MVAAECRLLAKGWNKWREVYLWKKIWANDNEDIDDADSSGLVRGDPTCKRPPVYMDANRGHRDGDGTDGDGTDGDGTDGPGGLHLFTKVCNYLPLFETSLTRTWHSHADNQVNPPQEPFVVNEEIPELMRRLEERGMSTKGLHVDLHQQLLNALHQEVEPSQVRQGEPLIRHELLNEFR